MIEKKIEVMTSEILDWVIEKRREIHSNPELSTMEYKTSKLVTQTLNQLGIKVETGYYNTGVVGIIEGEKNGPVIGLRFDMDALKMQELNDVPYKSKVDNVMHSCGHDGHTAMGLGIAKILSEMKEELCGTVKLVFQPAEEDAPRGGGAQHMIKDGVLKNPDVDCMFGMHIWPQLDMGTIAIKRGVMMAASDPFVIEIKGKGAHASTPNLGIDPIVVGSHLVTNIQTIVSRNIDPFEQAVISIGVFDGGTRYNVIPDKVTLRGTVRTFNEDVRQLVEKRLRKLVDDTCSSFGAIGKLDYMFSYPSLVNDNDLYDIGKQNVENILGEENCIELDRPTPGGEDFAYFAKEVPSMFMFLGSGEEDKINYPLHNPNFDFNEDVLGIGIKVMATNAIYMGRSMSRCID